MNPSAPSPTFPVDKAQRSNDRAGGEQNVNCLDARSQFPAVVDGMIGLSEWCPVEAHVAKCSDCRKLLDRLYRTRSRNEPQWGRASMRSIDLPDESADIIEAVTPARRSSHRALWVTVAAVALV